MIKNTSQHILSASANLLGFCLVVITSLHITNKATTSAIDEFSSSVALLLTFSCLCSFMSIRATKHAIVEKLETIADYLFTASLIGILIIILLLVFGYIQ